MPRRHRRIPLRLPHQRARGVRGQALAQLGDSRLVGHQPPVAAVDVVGGERLEARRRRHVRARREGARAALLLLGEIPGEIEPGRVRMRRVLEDAGADQEDRRRVGLREHAGDRLAGAHQLPGRGGGIETGELVAGDDGVRDRGVAGGDIGRLLGGVLVHVVPAVLLHDAAERGEGRIVVARIGGDELAGKQRFQEIERRLRHVGGRDPFGVVGVGDGVDADGDEGAVLVLVGFVNQLKAGGLPRQHGARLLPLREILDGLQNGDICLHLAGSELRLDFLVECGAQAAAEGHRHAGELLLEFLDPAVVGAGRTGAIEHHGLFVSGAAVKLVDALCARRRPANEPRHGGERQHSQRHPIG